MSTQTVPARATLFNLGWVALLTISGLATLNHLILIFVMPDEATLFLGWAAYNLYATVVLYIPFRRGETWAWFLTWTLVLGFALPILFSADAFAVWYLAAAGVMTVSLLLTRSVFFSRGARADR